MTKEQLLMPRYEVIADYPKSIHHVGTIINAGGRSEDLLYCDSEGPRCRDYPHLFKPLAWWENRNIEEMPEYIKNGEIVEKVIKWDVDEISQYCLLERGKYRHTLHNFNHIPATKEEYETYVKSVNQ